MLAQPLTQQIENWPIERLVEYPRNPRKNDKAVDRMVASIREFGFKIPVLARSDGEVVDGHLRLKAARKLGITEIPVILCDEWTATQVKAFRLMVNRSVTWADWDEELLALELQEIQEADFDLSLTGFDPGEIDGLLAMEDDEKANAAPPLPDSPVSRVGDLWLLGPHRALCGDATNAEVVARLLGERKPRLMVTDPPYGIELDSEWRDRAGLNSCGPAEPSYMKRRTKGHTETTISGDTRADWSEAFELVPSLEVAYVFHASKFTSEVLAGLLRIGFLHHQQIIWNKGRTVLTRTHYWFQHEPVWYVRKKNAPWFGKAGENSTIWDSPSPKFIMGGSDEQKQDHPTQKPVELMRRPILNHLRRGELVYDPFLGSGTTLAAAELNERVCYGIELDPKYVDVVVQRWQQLTGKQATLDTDGRTFDAIAPERQEGAV
jgi:DNA modification methylase